MILHTLKNERLMKIVNVLFKNVSWTFSHPLDVVIVAITIAKLYLFVLVRVEYVISLRMDECMKMNEW
jgi:hypothetical protein